MANTTALILDDVLGFARLSPSQSNAETAVATVIRLSVPVALLIGLLRIRSPGRPWPTSSWHSTGRPGPAGVRQALASALGDPSLTVCYWEPETRSFVGADGRPADPRPPPGRAATEVKRTAHRWPCSSATASFSTSGRARC